ncbi:phage tail tape measure protein [Clostridium intestinale]|uniref:Phage-related minor tail protein n=1 Tax=Clostridium intestinale DSM 6191 TaxID=1121320 RepID=A0A1M5TH30_9CLOT|nr:phage tail tape measure protein [Clostridium intestinale]SHH50024.1 Phage-related minor tail protein [Clostridium intestinale DSM 6191]
MTKIAGANIKIGANSSEFQKQMGDVVKQLKVTQSEFGLTSERAKLFGSSTDMLKVQQEQLSSKIKAQNTVVALNREFIRNLNKDIVAYGDRNKELAVKIEETDRKHKEAITTYGKNSTEVKNLEDELSKLKNTYDKNEKGIVSTNKRLDEAKIKLNNNEKALLQARNALEEVEKKLKTSSLDEFGKKLDKVSEASNKVAGTLGKVSLGVGAAFGLAGKEALDAEKSTAKLQAKLGATAEETEALTEVAKNVYRNGYGESLDDVTDSLFLLQSHFSTAKNWTQDTQEEMVGLVSTVKDVFGAENDEIYRTLKVMQDSGLEDNVDYALDIITRGFQEGGDYSGELLDSIREYSPQFVKLGLTADEALNYLITGAENGAFNLDKVGDAMKEFSVRAIDGSNTTQEGFKLIGLDANNMAAAIARGGDDAKEAFQKTLEGLTSIEDPLKQNQAGVDLFGTMWEDLGGNVINSLAGVTGGLSDVEGSTKRMQDAMNSTPQAQFQAALRDTKMSLLPLGTELLNIGKDLAPSVKSVLEDITGVLKNMSPETAKTVIGIGAFTMGAAGLAKGISTVTGGVSDAIKIINKMRESTFLAELATKGMTAAQTALNFVLNMNPIGLVVIGIGLLVGAFIFAYNKSEWFRDGVNGAFTKVKETGEWVFGGLKDFLGKWGLDILTVFVPFIGVPLQIIKHWDEIKGFFSGLKDFVSGKIRDMFSFQLPHIKLPHFKLNGEFSLLPPKVPSVGIDWYAEGGIMTSPTLFGFNGLNAMVGGEAGAEAILPLSQLWQELSKNFDELAERLNKNQLMVTIPIYLGDSELIKIAKVMTPIVGNQLAIASVRRRR